MTDHHREVWHEGEVYLHRALGIREKMETRGQKMMRDYMPDQHRTFFEQLPFVVLSAVDAKGHVWPFLRSGGPGFMQSPTPTRLAVSSTPLPGEPEDLQLGKGAKVSVLGIEVETKRRNRMNGTIASVSGSTLQIDIDLSFGNCPRYIHVRERIEDSETRPTQVTRAQRLSPTDRTLIARADMLFIASRAPDLTADRRAGVDVNHRGGLPGFVRVLDDETLVVPDYDGNNFFNTFGNIIRDPRSGILVPDLETGDLLTLIGQGEVVAEDPNGEALYGSNRYLRFRADTIQRAATAMPLRYRLVERSENPPKI